MEISSLDRIVKKEWNTLIPHAWTSTKPPRRVYKYLSISSTTKSDVK